MKEKKERKRPGTRVTVEGIEMKELQSFFKKLRESFPKVNFKMGIYFDNDEVFLNIIGTVDNGTPFSDELVVYWQQYPWDLDELYKLFEKEIPKKLKQLQYRMKTLSIIDR